MQFNLFLCLAVLAQLFCVRAEVGAECNSTQPCSGNLEVCSGDPGNCECTEVAVPVDKTCYAYATEKDNHCQFEEQCENLKDSSGSFMKKYTTCNKETLTCVCHGEHWFLKDSKCNRGLGASCTGLDTCAIENSHCSSPITGVCACKSDYKQEGEDKCVAKPECEVDSECMENGQCVNNKCKCREGFVVVQQLLSKVCLPYASPENEFSCSADEQCGLIKDESNPEGGAATCGLLSRVCGCKDDNWFLHQDEGNAKFPICVRGFGSQCSKDVQCQTGIKSGVCLEGECSCPEDHVTIEDEQKCLPYATEENNKCVIDEQCSRFYDGSGPFLNKHPKCDNNSQSCLCHEEHFGIMNDTCTRGYGAECHHLWKKCGVPNSRCGVFSSTCECKFGYVPNEISSTCDEKPECITDEDCPTNGQCVEKRCECNKGFVQTNFLFQTKCLPYATTENEFSCYANTQCSLIKDESGAETAMSKCGLFSLECECQDDTWFPTYDEKNKVGQCMRGFGSNCTTNAECQQSIANSMCVDNSCECPEDFATLEDQRLCLPYATIEENKCSYDEQCGNFKENNGPMMPKYPSCNLATKACSCRDEHSTLENGECIRGLGASCGPMRSCGLENTKCSALFECVCEYGYVQEEGSNVCTPRHECEAKEDCQENADCINNMCQCNDGFIEHDGLVKKQCLPYASVEDEYSCSHDDQCSLIVDESGEDSVTATCGVLSKKCYCKGSDWFIKTNKDGKSECVRGFGASCETTEDCTKSMKNSICEEKVCKCQDTHATIKNKNLCLPFATMEKNKCDYEEQCVHFEEQNGPLMPGYPTCNADTKACACRDENSFLQDGKCVRGLGASCGPTKSCGLEHSKCSAMFKCVCESGFVQEEGSNICTSRHECEAKEDCQENAACVDNMCKCNEGFIEHKSVLAKSCLPYSSSEDEFACSFDGQCSLIVDESKEAGSTATCGLLSKKCYCKDSSWFIQKRKDGRFECVRGFGSTCESTQDCTKSLKNSVCEENVCQCPQTHATIQDRNLCVPYATSKQNHCQYDEQCGLMKDSSATMFNQKPKCNAENQACQCHEEDWTLQGEECVRGLGAPCSALKSCGSEHSVCSAKYRGTCTCEEGFVQEAGTDVCSEIKA